jgi:hypothetical protein
MRFIMMYKPPRSHSATLPTPEQMAAIEKDIAEAKKNGTFVMNAGFQPMTNGAVVRLADGKTTVTDGPYVESKELIGGFAIFGLKSKEEAVESAKGFLQVMGGGEVEIRQLYEN